MYSKEIKKLLENFDDVQKYLIEDLDQEGLTPDDIEFEQMINEKALSKKQKDEIYQYYKDKASLITKLYFDELDETDRFAIEDLIADNLYPGDVEFDQLLNQRTVNKDKIYKYFDYKKNEFLLNYNRNEKDFIDQLIKDGITIDDEEFNKRIKETRYDKDKIIKYINNMNWINNTNDYIQNINNKKKEDQKKEITKEEINIEDSPVNDEVEIDDKKREIFNEIQENLKKKNNSNNTSNNIINNEMPTNKPVNNNIDPYEGLDYYERLSLYAKEKEKNPSNLDSYDDELVTLKRKEKEINNHIENNKKIKNLKKKKKWLYALKEKFSSKNNDLGDEDINKLGFIDIISMSILVILTCILILSIINLFK